MNVRLPFLSLSGGLEECLTEVLFIFEPNIVLDIAISMRTGFISSVNPSQLQPRPGAFKVHSEGHTRKRARSPSLACIVGATDGIGRAYAEELASRGLNIILISRSQDKLRMVANDIADTYKVETEVIVADFSNGREIYDPIREALKDKDIGILVNNVGVFYPYPQYFTQVSEDKLWDIINVNIAAASLMVHIVLPGMVERKKGAVVTISSGSCCKPTPQLAAFSASKVVYS